MEKEMKEDDKHIDEFRKVLRKIKQSVINNSTYKTQNTNDLKDVSKRLIQFYTLLRPIIFDRKPISSLAIKELQPLFHLTLEEYSRSNNYQMLLEYYLKRDFIDFPYTLDEEQIDSFNEPIHNEIVSNDILLTEERDE